MRKRYGFAKQYPPPDGIKSADLDIPARLSQPDALRLPKVRSAKHHQRPVARPTRIALTAINRSAATIAKVIATAAAPTAGSPVQEP